MSSQDVNLLSLKNAIKALQQKNPHAPWVVSLNKVIEEIRTKALHTNPVAFDSPIVHGIEKVVGKPERRPLAIFDLQDRIITSLTARYLREHMDHTLDRASLAFRCRRGKKSAPRHHDAVKKILTYIKRCKKKRFYVAECDIRGFFDVVDHQLARQSLDTVLRRAILGKRVKKIDPRPLLIFDAYMDCYTFPRNVLRIEEPKLRQKKPDAIFKWPESELTRFHTRPLSAAIGVPQGGALSAVVANTLLDQADRALRKLRRKFNFLYLRYCDDMVIIAPTKQACTKAFNLYLSTLESLKLPAHPPKSPSMYDADHWQGKSRNVYRWGPDVKTGDIPWVQFVGYHIRHDGLLRIRKDSFRKHIVKVVEAVDEVVAHVSRPHGKHKKNRVRKTVGQIAHRLRMRLLSMSVGQPPLYQAKQGPRPQTWCAGFECLHRQPFLVRQLKALDRHRERQLRRLARHLKHVKAPKISDSPKKKALKFYGHPFSYYGQFDRSSAVDRVHAS